jgi:uncharacterized membrane protein
MIFYLLLVSYGICFGLQNKVTFLRGKYAIIDSMLVCTYCTGFHSGWITWLLANTEQLHDLWIIDMVLFAFGSSAFCYAIDTLIRLIENYAGEITIQDDEK